MHRIANTLLYLLVVGSGALPAQKLGFATVTNAGPGEMVAAMMPFQRSVALGADGNWYVLVDRHKSVRDPYDIDLELWRSVGGAQWQLAATAPGARDGRGVLVAEPERQRLHLVWEGRGDGEWPSVFHIAFDLQGQQFVGAPVRLAHGTGINDQYYANDACLAAGKLVVAIGAHRSPQTKGYPGWATGLRVLGDLDGGADSWSQPQMINVGTAGIWADLAERDGVVHSSYRTYADSGHCIAMRSYDVARGEFVQRRDVRVTPTGGGELSNSNASLTAVDQLGDRYVMSVLGTGQGGNGQFVVAHAPHGSDTWTTLVLAADRPQRGGNYNPRCLALARGPGNQMLAFYSKEAEQNSVLYVQVLDAGRVVGAERVVERGCAGAFAQLCGVRQSPRRMGVQLVVGGAVLPTDGGATSGTSVRVYGLLR
ncbi:MAG: hypothetical protein H6838_18860 [Planctomycetes bacterium]|nr:hypothetical protein [Planctomycetota bacterium]MCB9887559.1 hypothetical protein [Planctomycetota bacterium]